MWLRVRTRARADCPGHCGEPAAVGAPGTSSLLLVPAPPTTAGIFLAPPYPALPSIPLPPLGGASGSFFLQFHTQDVHCLSPSPTPSLRSGPATRPLGLPPRPLQVPCSVGRRRQSRQAGPWSPVSDSVGWTRRGGRRAEAVPRAAPFPGPCGAGMYPLWPRCPQGHGHGQRSACLCAQQRPAHWGSLGRATVIILAHGRGMGCHCCPGSSWGTDVLIHLVSSTPGPRGPALARGGAAGMDVASPQGWGRGWGGAAPPAGVSRPARLLETETTEPGYQLFIFLRNGAACPRNLQIFILTFFL